MVTVAMSGRVSKSWMVGPRRLILWRKEVVVILG